MKDKTIVALFGIGAITAIVITCAYKNIDGTIIAGGRGIIGTIIGYCFGYKGGGK